MSKKKKYNSNILFYIGYFLLVISQMYVNVPFINKHHSIFLILGYALVCFFILFSFPKMKFDKKKILKMITLMLILVILYFYSQDTTIFQLFLIAFGLIFIDITEFFKTDLKIKLFLIFTLILLYFFNIVDSPDFYRENGLYRYTLGFQHPNILGTYIMILIFQIYYLYFPKKLDVKFIVLQILSILFEIFVCNTKSCCIILIIFFIYYIFSNIKRFELKPNKKIIYIFENLPIIFSVVSFLLVFLYSLNIDFMNDINKFLSYRIYYYKLYFDEIKLSLFGNDMNNFQSNVALDNSYIYLLLKFGFIQFIIIIYYLKNILKNAIYNNKNMIVVIMALLLIYGIIESFFLIPTVNCFILLIAIVLKKHLINGYNLEDIK